MKVKWRRSTWIIWALLIYVTISAIYLLPHNLLETSMEKIYTVVGSYIIVFFLWMVLRRKENSHRRKENGE